MSKLKSEFHLPELIFISCNYHFHFSLSCIGEEMATHSSILAWRLPGTEEPWWAAVYGVAQSQDTTDVT